MKVKEAPMRKSDEHTLRKRIGVLSCFMVLGLLISLGFKWHMAITIFAIEVPLLIWLCEKLFAQYDKDKGQTGRIFLFFQMVCLLLVTLILFFITVADYEYKVSYGHWLSHIDQEETFIPLYELATHLVVYYIGIVAIGYGNLVFRMVAAKIEKWFPPYFGLIIAVCFMIFTRGGFNQLTKLVSLLVGMVLLIFTLLAKRASDKKNKVTYVMHSKHYFVSFFLISMLILSIGTAMPMLQELPGTRWIKNIRTNWGQSKSLSTEIPFSSELKQDISLSDAVLFEIEASETLYLRDMAYNDYEDSIWRIEDKGSYREYINFEPIYLQAEYEQTKSLINEMMWMRSERPELFWKYKDLISYENTINMKKQLKVNQNPINKINYFTINGFRSIEDEEVKEFYYYGSLDNLFFHSKQLVEPTEYTLTYLNRVPKPGSREYVFLKNLSHDEFLQLYAQLQEYRKKGYYNKTLIPRILQTYTPLVQYNKAKKDYLQMPSYLKEDITKLTKKVVGSTHSDWDQADQICGYLRTQYIYNQQKRPIEEEDSVYHFLFKQKQGICQDFASSMVLMCRSIDLPARYVTGYLVSEKKPNAKDTYIVREKNAHAFVEVYLAGYGWMQFDPTPSSAQIGNKIEAAIDAQADDVQLVIIVILLLVAFSVVKRGSSLLWDLYWHIGIYVRKDEKVIESIMRQSLYVLAQQGYPKAEHETIFEYASRMKTLGKQINEMVHIFQRYTFGGIPPTKEELKKVIKDYHRLKKGNKT